MGNHTPVADLMVGHQNGEQFGVDVKGIVGRNSWWGKPKNARSNLFYVLVSLGEQRPQDRFFILAQAEFNDLVTRYQNEHPAQKKVGGFAWTFAHPYEDCWGKLPGWGERNSN